MVPYYTFFIYPLPEVSPDQFYFLTLPGYFSSLVMFSVMVCLFPLTWLYSKPLNIGKHFVHTVHGCLSVLLREIWVYLAPWGKDHAECQRSWASKAAVEIGNLDSVPVRWDSWILHLPCTEWFWKFQTRIKMPLFTWWCFSEGSHLQG